MSNGKTATPSLRSQWPEKRDDNEDEEPSIAIVAPDDVVVAALELADAHEAKVFWLGEKVESSSRRRKEAVDFAESQVVIISTNNLRPLQPDNTMGLQGDVFAATLRVPVEEPSANK